MSEPDLPIPVLDNHMHCDPKKGEGIDAVKKFERSGGTHLCMVNKPSWGYGIQASSGDDFRDVFDYSLSTAEDAREFVTDVFPVLGVHPGLITNLVEWGKSVDEAEEIMKEGLEVAAEYVEEGEAVALKSGRPHYEVSDEIWEASNNVMEHAFRLGGEVGCAVQLHTEGASQLEEITDTAESVGMNPDRVVKHFAPPDLEGPVPSVLAKEDQIRQAVEEREDRFMMETDYIDDPDRPGAVLGLRTVPRRVRSLIDDHEEVMYEANVETPEDIYGVEISLD
ncbi:TatD family hydrolase [Halorutilales archaeon Cl-col2-1]